jgi:chromosome segregation ATPase
MVVPPSSFTKFLAVCMTAAVLGGCGVSKKQLDVELAGLSSELGGQQRTLGNNQMEMRDDLKTVQATLQATQADVALLRSTIQQLTQDLQKINAEIAAAREERAKMAADFREAFLLFNDLKPQAASLRAVSDRLSELTRNYDQLRRDTQQSSENLSGSIGSLRLEVQANENRLREAIGKNAAQLLNGLNQQREAIRRTLERFDQIKVELESQVETYGADTGFTP